MKKGDAVLYIDKLSINQATVTDIMKKEGCYKESITKVKLSNGRIFNASFEFFNDLESAKKALKDKIDYKLSALISERDSIDRKIEELNKLSNAFEL